MAKKYLRRACEYLGIEPSEAINPRIEDGAYVLIVDKGIDGSPKYRIPLSELDEPEPADFVITDPEVVKPEPEPVAVDDLGAYGLSYRELQSKAKELDIPANQSKDELIAALWPADEEA